MGTIIHKEKERGNNCLVENGSTKIDKVILDIRTAGIKYPTTNISRYATVDNNINGLEDEKCRNIYEDL